MREWVRQKRTQGKGRVQLVSTERYHIGAAWLHWLIAALVIANIGLAMGTEDMAREARGPYMDVHKAFGILILVLTLVRIGWRVRYTPPAPLTTIPLWQRRASLVVHYIFYGLLLLLPLSGWLWMSTYGVGIDMFGLFEVPGLGFENNESLGDFLHEAHELMGKGLLGLVVLHSLAALKHQFIDRNNILSRIQPWK